MSRRVRAPGGDIAGSENDWGSDLANDDASTRKRKLGHDANDVAANCFLAPSSLCRELVNMKETGTDGLVFGFTADMNGISEIPEETFQQVL